jgi:hypothetical protein
MSPTQRDALMLACKVLDHAAEVADRPGLMRTCEEAADALRAALTEPVSEAPVAWYRPSEEGYDSAFRDHSTVVACAGNKWEGWIPLYTHPTARGES